MRELERSLARADLDSALVAVNQGAPPNAILRNGETPAVTMTRLGAAEHLAALVHMGARLDHPAPRTGLTPLVLAVRANDRRMVQAVLELGASVDQVLQPVEVFLPGEVGRVGMGIGMGGLAGAGRRRTGGGTGVIETKAGEAGDGDDGNGKGVALPRLGRSEGMSPLMMAAGLGTKWLAILVDLLDAGASPDLPNEQGRTALMFAARFGCIGTTRVLLDDGCNPFLLDAGGFSAGDWVRACARERATRERKEAGEGEGENEAGEFPEGYPQADPLDGDRDTGGEGQGDPLDDAASLRSSAITGAGLEMLPHEQQLVQMLRHAEMRVLKKARGAAGDDAAAGFGEQVLDVALKRLAGAASKGRGKARSSTAGTSGKGGQPGPEADDGAEDESGPRSIVTSELVKQLRQERRRQERLGAAVLGAVLPALGESDEEEEEGEEETSAGAAGG